MKLGIIGDLHSNVHALDAVLISLKQSGIDHLFVLGDMFGYYPWALQTWRRLQELPWPSTFIKGNHDEMLLKRFKDPNWTIQASYSNAIVQNLEELRETPALTWLETLSFDFSLELGHRTLRLVHGTPVDPENGRFYPDNHEVQSWFPKAGEWLFLGHTHYPIVRQTGDGGWIVNPGSVGQSRDGDPRATFAIVDLESGEHVRRREWYDIASAQTELRSKGWDESAIRALDKRRGGVKNAPA